MDARQAYAFRQVLQADARLCSACPLHGLVVLRAIRESGRLRLEASLGPYGKQLRVISLALGLQCRPVDSAANEPNPSSGLATTECAEVAAEPPYGRARRSCVGLRPQSRSPVWCAVIGLVTHTRSVMARDR